MILKKFAKKTKKMNPIIKVGFIFYFICVLFSISGRLYALRSFAVDSSEKLYLGRMDSYIFVISDGKTVSQINPRMARYSFYIDENDNIWVCGGNSVYELSLNGDIIYETDDENQIKTIYQKSENSMFNYVAYNGDEYKLTYVLGRTRIIKNGTEQVYIDPILMPLQLFIVIMLIIIPFILFAVNKLLKNKELRQNNPYDRRL